MLTIIGAAGLIGLALIAAGVIPLSLDPVMQYVFYGVLIVFFGVFLIMGINALKKSGEYKSRISEEYARERSLMEWLMQDAQKQRFRWMPPVGNVGGRGVFCLPGYDETNDSGKGTGYS